MAAALARANFGQAQQFLADAAAAQIGTHPEIVDEKPVAVGAAGQPRGDVAIRLADKDAEPLPFRVVQMRSIMLAELAAKPVTRGRRGGSSIERCQPGGKSISSSSVSAVAACCRQDNLSERPANAGVLPVGATPEHAECRGHR